MTMEEKFGNNVLFTHVLAQLKAEGPKTMKALLKSHGITEQMPDFYNNQNKLIAVLDAHRALGAIHKDGQVFKASDVNYLHGQALDEYRRAQHDEINRAPIGVVSAFLECSRNIGDGSDSEGWRIYSAWQEYDSTRRKLADLSARLARTMQEVNEKMSDATRSAGWNSVNSGGEVQGQGSEIDIACAMVERERSNFSAEITWRASDEYRQRLIAHVRASKAKVLAQEIKASAIDEAKDILQEMATDNNQEPKRDLAFEIASGLNTGN
jgi:hypothetical protein